jgi:RNA polymerase sigma-70 factor (ECF subfamily)
LNTPPNNSTSHLKTTFLVLRCQTGDEDAFHRLYQFFSDSTLRYLTSVVGPDLAKDVQQEAWISVLRKIKGLDNPKRFKPWLYRIVRHSAIDHLRRLKRDQRLFEYPDDNSEGFDIRSGESTDEELNLDAIKHAVSRLSPVHQEVVVLRYWEEFSYAEVALVTGIPIGSVRSRLYHAKAHLKKLFETEIDPY